MTVRAARAAGTRERIVDAALASYRERGIGATSLQTVARRADVSPATILNHFGTAEELARVVVSRLTEDIRIPDDREWTESGHAPRVRRLVREVFAFYDRSTPWFEVFRYEMDNQALRDGQANFWEAVGALYTRVLGPALADDRVRSAVFGLTHPVTLNTLRQAGLSLDDASALVAETVLRLVAPGTDNGPSLWS